MRSTTSATDPVSYYEVLSTFWAVACAARGTDLRGQSLVNLEVLGSKLDSFVVELGSKLRPAGIEYGLRQAGSGKPTGIYVADADAPVLPHEPGGERAAAAKLTVERAAESEPISALEEDHRVTVPADRARRLEWTHSVHGRSLLFKVPTGGRILDPVPVRQHHGYMVVDTRRENKIDAKHPAGIFTPDLPSVCDAETHASTNSIATCYAPPPRRERRGFRRGELG
jgi:hypothetical protein